MGATELAINRAKLHAEQAGKVAGRRGKINNGMSKILQNPDVDRSIREAFAKGYRIASRDK